MPDNGAVLEILDDGEVTGVAVEAQGEDAVELFVVPDVVAVEVETTEFLEFDDGRGPTGPNNLAVGAVNTLPEGMAGMWVETGLGDGSDFTIWIEDGS